MTFNDTSKPYRITTARWFRWQSEWPGVCRFARRGRTARAAERRMRHDVAVAVTYGRRSWSQWWREKLADVR